MTVTVHDVKHALAGMWDKQNEPLPASVTLPDGTTVVFIVKERR